MTQTKLEKRVTSLEKVNTRASDKSQDDRTITLKEVFERLIRVDERTNFMKEKALLLEEKNDQITRRFYILVAVVIVLEFLNFLLHFVLITPLLQIGF